MASPEAKSHGCTDKILQPGRGVEAAAEPVASWHSQAELMQICKAGATRIGSPATECHSAKVDGLRALTARDHQSGGTIMKQFELIQERVRDCEYVLARMAQHHEMLVRELSEWRLL